MRVRTMQSDSNINAAEEIVGGPCAPRAVASAFAGPPRAERTAHLLDCTDKNTNNESP